ncbi:murein biosynthesis integral membrane protein MurJ [Clostridium paridis]|uniref:Probable lipid II flippase MurJ n=1 Tax=Clostridium paridis TaxID=2803863 RepID=A0A937K4D0_9CLOT|nr:murein biosynthesis integral membrane protein MurJ [Clostridium paridis]MBL4931065.1 murein biosynthesis integral membrane protein MurJ [Clostridium paridis]
MNSRKILKSTFIIMAVSILSRGIGFIRDMLIASSFGTGLYADAYSVAVTIPESLFMIIGLAISTSFLPVLSEQLIKNGKNKMHEFANKVITLLVVISIGVFLISFIFARQIVPFFASGYSGEKLELTIFLTRITMLNLLFLAVNACFSSILQVNEDFIVPSILGLFFNAPMIIYLVFFNGYSIVGLTIANVIGNIARVLVQIPSLIKHGYIYKPDFKFKDERIRKVLLLIAPVIIGAGANSINMMVDIKIAGYLEEGSVAALNYSQKLIVFLNTIITSSILTVTFPLMANSKNSEDKEGFIQYVKKTIIYTMLLLIPIATAAIIYNQDIIKMIYMRNEFTLHSVSLTRLAFLGYLIGLAFYGIRDILNSTLFSMGRTKDTTINGVIGVIANILFNIILSKIFGIIGISIATSSALIITSVLLLSNINRVVSNFNMLELIIKLFKILFASIIMGVILVFINSTFNIVLNIKTIIPITLIGMLIYYIFCMILRINEINEISLLFLKKIRRK